MGLLGDILSRVKDVISDVETAVEQAVKLFGEVARFLEDVIRTIKQVIEEITTLFNLSKIEYMFIHPFKEAAFTALSDIKYLVSIAIRAGGEGKNILNDIIDGAEQSINAVVQKIKDGMSDFEDATSRLIQKIKDEAKNISYDVFASFDEAFNDIESFPSYLDDFGKAVEKMFRVEVRKTYKVVTEFDDVVEKSVVQTKHDIASIGERTFQPLDKFKQTIETRIRSEGSALDLLVLIFIGLIIGAVIGVYMITHSVSTVIFVVSFLVILMLIVLVVEMV